LIRFPDAAVERRYFAPLLIRRRVASEPELGIKVFGPRGF
jgi:hypothetical protein